MFKFLDKFSGACFRVTMKLVLYKWENYSKRKFSKIVRLFFKSNPQSLDLVFQYVIQPVIWIRRRALNSFLNFISDSIFFIKIQQQHIVHYTCTMLSYMFGFILLNDFFTYLNTKKYVFIKIKLKSTETPLKTYKRT